MGPTTAQLGHGRFYGDYRERRQAGDLDLAELRPTVPEHEVDTHTHDDAHFLLLLEGNYLSSAQGMPAVCNTRALVLNPPGRSARKIPDSSNRTRQDRAPGRCPCMAGK